MLIFKDDLSTNVCEWKFDHYLPSAWEQDWHDKIDELQENVCRALAQPDQVDKSVRALNHIINLQKTLFNGSSNPADHFLSRMYYRRECSRTRSTQLVFQLIEPLIGLLRDPLTICPRINNDDIPLDLYLDGDHDIQSKRFFLLAPSAPHSFSKRKLSPIAPWFFRSGSQKIFFDIGSSYFISRDGNTTGPHVGPWWFYEYFRTKSLKFDRIFAYEYQELSSKKFWEQVPDDVFASLTFINVGVEEKGKFNPWNTLRSVARPEDYVIVKLDIDTPPLETALIQQLLDDEELRLLIDELFFEMHVTVNAMEKHWGTPPGNLRTTYDLYSKFRRYGIRMHSWS